MQTKHTALKHEDCETELVRLEPDHGSATLDYMRVDIVSRANHAKVASSLHPARGEAARTTPLDLHDVFTCAINCILLDARGEIRRAGCARAGDVFVSSLFLSMDPRICQDFFLPPPLSLSLPLNDDYKSPQRADVPQNPRSSGSFSGLKARSRV